MSTACMFRSGSWIATYRSTKRDIPSSELAYQNYEGSVAHTLAQRQVPTAEIKI